MLTDQELQDFLHELELYTPPERKRRPPQAPPPPKKKSNIFLYFIALILAQGALLFPLYYKMRTWEEKIDALTLQLDALRQAERPPPFFFDAYPEEEVIEPLLEDPLLYKNA